MITLSMINIINRTTCILRPGASDRSSKFQCLSLSANVSQANGVACTFELTLDSFALQWMLKYTICKEVLFFDTFIIVEVHEVPFSEKTSKIINISMFLETMQDNNMIRGKIMDYDISLLCYLFIM